MMYNVLFNQIKYVFTIFSYKTFFYTCHYYTYNWSVPNTDYMSQRFPANYRNLIQVSQAML